MTVPARLFTGEGHFVGETWMAGLRPTHPQPTLFHLPSPFEPSLIAPPASRFPATLPELVRIQMFGRGCTEANENRITCPPNWRPAKRAGAARCYGSEKKVERLARGEGSPFSFIFARDAALLKISSEYEVGVVQ